MAHQDESPPPDSGWEMFSRRVGATERRRLRAGRVGFREVWFGLGMFGVVGWSVAIPVVLLTALGVWIDGRYPGRFSWALMLLAVGVGLGCANAWYWVAGERRIIESESQCDGADHLPPGREKTGPDE